MIDFRTVFARILVAVLTASALIALASPAYAKPGAPAPAEPPRLIIAVVVDQLSADLFEQNRTRFRYGLARLARDGDVFVNGYQGHAATETCPGHSTVLSGQHPSQTGIIANAWFDPVSKKTVYCVGDPTVSVPNRPENPRGPLNLRSPTLADWLKASNPQARVFSISAKDRAALAMVGRNADGVFWWDDANGWTTYVPPGATAENRLAPVASVNAALFEAWKTRPPQWRRIDNRCRRLNAIQHFGEATIDSQAPPTFYGPPAPDLPETVDARFFANLAASPMIDDITLDLARHLVDTQALGADAVPDLLAVSLSATDRIGHRFGTKGPEMCDQLAHLDRSLGRFLGYLDSRKIPYALALTADHGATDASERSAAHGLPARRINPAWLWEAVNTAVKSSLNLNFEPLRGDGDQVWFVDSARTDPAMRARVEAAALEALRARDDVVSVFTRNDVTAAPPATGSPATWTVPQRLALSFDAQRSGDLFVVFPQYASLGLPQKPGDTVAGHGSTWDYDRRVPIIFLRSGLRGVSHADPIETVDIGPTLGALVGVSPSAPTAGHCVGLTAAACR